MIPHRSETLKNTPSLWAVLVRSLRRSNPVTQASSWIASSLRFSHAVGGKAVSFATQDAQQEILWLGFKELRVLGFKLNDVRGFKERHLKNSLKALSLLVQKSLRMNMIFTGDYRSGDMPIKRSITGTANLPEMKMGMDFMKCMLIQSKDFGHCYAPG